MSVFSECLCENFYLYLSTSLLYCRPCNICQMKTSRKNTLMSFFSTCSSRLGWADRASYGPWQPLYSDTAGLYYTISRCCFTQRYRNRESYRSCNCHNLYNWDSERNADVQDKHLKLELIAKTNKLLHDFLTTTWTTPRCLTVSANVSMGRCNRNYAAYYQTDRKFWPGIYVYQELYLHTVTSLRIV